MNANLYKNSLENVEIHHEIRNYKNQMTRLILTPTSLLNIKMKTLVFMQFYTVITV